MMNDADPSNPEPGTPADQAQPPVQAPQAVAGEERIGRFTRSELEAMRGKRGRKPPEYHQLFGAPVARTAKAPKAVRAKGGTRARAIPSVSTALLGEHSVDELLQMIGRHGRKPPAYGILQRAAQVFADQCELELPPAPAPAVRPAKAGKPAKTDPLAARLAAAPRKVRATVEALLAISGR